ncbi:MAG TPA: alpha/beta hydrolase [Acidimicrobiales bacterium]|nr:alpha/beta hydrolase [Acidimicrobiales bacterium]
MRKVFGGGTIFGAATGAAPFRVLALPGWMHPASDFDAALAGLPAGGVALDLPGFGGPTAEPPEAWGAAEYAKAVLPVFDDLAPPAVVVGHSFGGRVAVHLAATHPELVAGLVLTGVPLLRRTDRPAARPAVSYRVARFLNRRGLLPDERMEALRRRHGSADYRAATGVMRDVLVKVTNETYEEQLRAVQCPVEMVWGERDDAAPVSVAEAARAMIPSDAVLTVLPGVDHFVPTAAPDALRAAIERVLA